MGQGLGAWGKAASTASLLSLALASGCATQLAPSEPWRAAADITGELAPNIGPAPAAAAPLTIDSLSVVTFNVQDGGASPDQIAAALAGADVVLLQEEEAFASEGAPRAAELARLLGLGWFYAPARLTLDGNGTFGDAILSRYPMSDLRVIDLPRAENKLQRIALRATLDVGGTPVTVINTHLDTTINITTRVRQLHPAVIDAPDVAFVGGDFNMNPYAWESGDVPLVPDSVVVDTDQAAALDDYMASLDFVDGTAALGDTEIRYGLSSRLDAVYTRGVVPGSGRVARDVPLSDHWPVWLDVKILR